MLKVLTLLNVVLNCFIFVNRKGSVTTPLAANSFLTRGKLIKCSSTSTITLCGSEYLRTVLMPVCSYSAQV